MVGWARRTRLGGSPLLAFGMSWPRNALDIPLAFVAQVDLSELVALSSHYRLPESGILSFFADCDLLMHVKSAAGEADTRVVYTPAREIGDHNAQSPTDLPEAAAFGEIWVRPFVEVSIPGPESPQVTALDLTVQERRLYNDLMVKLSDDALLPFRAGAIHRFLGHPWPIQWDVSARAKRTVTDRRVGQPPAAGDSAFILLLQVRDDALAGMQWGSEGGVAYFMIPSEALANGDFAQSLLVMQSH
jgi:hypothetical protein